MGRSSERTGRRGSARLSGVLGAAALGMLLRILLIAALGPDAPPPRANDHLVYYEAARELAGSAEAWVRPIGPFGYRAPLYFVYLSGLFALDDGMSYRAAQAATALLGVLTAIVMFAVGRRIGGTRAAWWSLGLRLFLPSFVVADTFVMSEPLFSLALMSSLLAFLALLERPASWGAALGLGAALGAALLTRESASLLPLVLVFAVWGIGGTTRERLVRTGGFLLALGMVLLPWAARNHHVWGKPLPLAHTAGVNLYIGNNPAATGHWGEFDPVAPPEIRIGTPEANAWFAQAAARFILEDPARFVASGMKKLAWFLFPVFHRDTMATLYLGHPQAVTWLSLACGATSAVLLLLGTAAIIRAARTRFWWTIVAIVLYQAAIVFVAFGSPRFRDVVDHGLVLFVALMAAEPRSAPPLDRGRGVAALILGLGILAAWGYIAWLKTTGRA